VPTAPIAMDKNKSKYLDNSKVFSIYFRVSVNWQKNFRSSPSKAWIA
jgi:hypothetical protein